MTYSNKWCCKGSVTVEAVLLVPFVLFVIFAIILLCFCMYNRAKLRGDVTEGLEYAREEYELSGKKDCKKIHEYIALKMQKGYVFCKEPEISVELYGDTLSISADIEMQISPKGVTGALASGFRHLTIVKGTVLTDREAILRGISIVGDIKER